MGQLSRIECSQVSQDHAESALPGVFYNVDGAAATLVYDGYQPHPAAWEPLADGAHSHGYRQTILPHLCSIMKAHSPWGKCSHQRRLTPYASNAVSPLTIGMPSTSACATSNRSNGSL